MRYLICFILFFCSVGIKAQSPGGQSANLKMWLKANAGATATRWNDQTSNNYDFYQNTASLRPVLNNDIINFNPAYYFDGADYFRGENRKYRQALVYFVIIGQDFGQRSRLLNDNNYSLRYEQWNGTNKLGFTRYNIRDYVSNIPTPFNQVAIISFEKPNNSYVFMKRIVDGVRTQQNLNTQYTNNSFPLNEYGQFLKGYTAEIVFYDRAQSATVENRIESYLAVKYGITLHSHYYNSVGTIIWNRNSNYYYRHDVAGIARDGSSGLDQRKSKSVNPSAIISIANGTNFSSPSGFPYSPAFMLWGHNDGATKVFNQTFLGFGSSGIPRKWRVSENGDVQTVTLRVPKSMLPSNVNNLVVGTNANFPRNSTTKLYRLNSVGNDWEVKVNFSHNNYFSFYRNKPPAISNIETALIPYCNNPVQITNTITVADPELKNVSGRVAISNGYASGQDKLVYTPVPGVTIYAITDSAITFRSATTAQIRDALRSVSFENNASSSVLVTGNRTIRFTVNDGTSESNFLTRDIYVSKTPMPKGIFND